jgi:hypothetical protein
VNRVTAIVIMLFSVVRCHRLIMIVERQHAHMSDERDGEQQEDGAGEQRPPTKWQSHGRRVHHHKAAEKSACQQADVGRLAPGLNAM